MREPNDTEKQDLLQYLLSMYNEVNEESNRDASETMNRSWIGVADNYCSDGPGYVGKIIVIIFPADPGTHEVLCYDDAGKLYRVQSEYEAVARQR